MKKSLPELVKVSLRVTPGASKNDVSCAEGVYKVRLTAPPVEGKANRALIEYLAKKLDVPRSVVEIISGASSRNKTILISGLSPDEIYKRLAK